MFRNKSTDTSLWTVWICLTILSAVFSAKEAAAQILIMAAVCCLISYYFIKRSMIANLTATGTVVSAKKHLTLSDIKLLTTILLALYGLTGLHLPFQVVGSCGILFASLYANMMAETIESEFVKQRYAFIRNLSEQKKEFLCSPFALKALFERSMITEEQAALCKILHSDKPIETVTKLEPRIKKEMLEAFKRAERFMADLTDIWRTENGYGLQVKEERFERIWHTKVTRED